ncbi:response regulator transcription factor [Verrucomicrobiales bacterium]|jgi:DNA-binding NarL/FixJ family response regulator|nr:response regulator transcription factor [Verrucomicrobiales bacterium]
MSEVPLIRLLLVDDHFVVRSGLVASLGMAANLEVVGEAESGEEGLSLFQAETPDVVLMDLQLPGWSGIETSEKILEVSSSAKILMFSTFARDDEIQTALDTGVLGYLQKSAERSELITALETVAAGKAYLRGGLAASLAKRDLGPNITQREREILARVAKGKANKEIASDLGIAEDTVKRHMSHVFRKLGVNDRAQATAEAIRQGIVSVD